MNLVVSCEHAGNVLPEGYAHLFASDREVLATHRGWDPGTAILGQELASVFKASLISTDVTRLLVDCNRSSNHRNLFSFWSQKLSKVDRQGVLDRFYHPHRNRVRSTIEAMLNYEKSLTVHLGVHSFTPVWEGKPRMLDIGLLYDPARPLERQFCDRWKEELSRTSGQWRVRRNQPYLGKADGLTTQLRGLFKGELYAGIELEVNQAIVLEDGEDWSRLRADLAGSLGRILKSDWRPKI